MLSANGLLEQARRISQLDDYGDMGFAEGLRVLIKSINEEAGLSADNEALMKDGLLRVLVNRLRMQRDIGLHPEILDEGILPPVFITSLPRTGSTKLHRMLAASGDFNAMQFWQAHNFARIPGAEQVTPDPRIATAEQYLQWLYKRSPEFQQAHPMYTEETEEELGLLDAGFNSLYQYAVLLDVPGYVQWVIGQDGLQMFRDLRRMLQYLQWQHFRGRKGRWVLKTPSFFGLESAFAKVFSGADFIVTHRHPELTMASACTLLCGVRKLYNDRDSTSIAGPAVLFNFGEMLKGHLQWRENYPADKVMDVRFEDINRREFDLLPRIYALLGMRFTEAAKQNIQAWLEMDAQRTHQRNHLTLEHYGITRAAVSERLGAYTSRYAEYLPSDHPSFF